VPDAAEDLELVDLEVHPGRAAVAQPPAGQLGGQDLVGDRHPGRQAFQGRDQRRPMGLPGGQETKTGTIDLMSEPRVKLPRMSAVSQVIAPTYSGVPFIWQ
jgi:hypothetical protein